MSILKHEGFIPYCRRAEGVIRKRTKAERKAIEGFKRVPNGGINPQSVWIVSCGSCNFALRASTTDGKRVKSSLEGADSCPNMIMNGRLGDIYRSYK